MTRWFLLDSWKNVTCAKTRLISLDGRLILVEITPMYKSCGMNHPTNHSESCISNWFKVGELNPIHPPPFFRHNYNETLVCVLVDSCTLLSICKKKALMTCFSVRLKVTIVTTKGVAHLITPRRQMNILKKAQSRENPHYEPIACTI